MKEYNYSLLMPEKDYCRTKKFVIFILLKLRLFSLIDSKFPGSWILRDMDGPLFSYPHQSNR